MCRKSGKYLWLISYKQGASCKFKGGSNRANFKRAETDFYYRTGASHVDAIFVTLMGENVVCFDSY